MGGVGAWGELTRGMEGSCAPGPSAESDMAAIGVSGGVLRTFSICLLQTSFDPGAAINPSVNDLGGALHGLGWFALACCGAEMGSWRDVKGCYTHNMITDGLPCDRVLFRYPQSPFDGTPVDASPSFCPFPECPALVCVVYKAR